MVTKNERKATNLVAWALHKGEIYSILSKSDIDKFGFPVLAYISALGQCPNPNPNHYLIPAVGNGVTRTGACPCMPPGLAALGTKESLRLTEVEQKEELFIHFSDYQVLLILTKFWQ